MVGQLVESRRRDPSRGVRADWPRKIFENWNFGKCDFLRFGHQILVAVLVTLHDLVTL